MKTFFLFLFFLQVSIFTYAQPVPLQREDVNALVQKVKDKINLVNDYEAR